jgi:thiaminase/transcriptional activator TenA
LRDFGVDPASVAGAEPSPDCLAYTSYLIAAAYHEPWEVLVAALLPCFWLYWDVGCAIARSAAPQNPYKAWVETYSDERFGDTVRAVIAITNRAADTASALMKTKMLAAFIRACQYEWLFWDSAYRRRGWPTIG